MTVEKNGSGHRTPRRKRTLGATVLAIAAASFGVLAGSAGSTGDPITERCADITDEQIQKIVDARVRELREKTGTYQLEDYRHPEDGDDWGPALRRLMTECRGCTVQLQAAEYNIRSHSDICVPMTIRGTSAGGPQLKSRLVTYGNSLFTARPRDWCRTHVLGDGALNSSFEDFAVFERAATQASNPRVAFQVETSVRMSNLWVRGFRHSVVADCGAKRGVTSLKACKADPSQCREVTNCNLVHIDLSYFDSTDHAAVVFQGPDSNAGSMTRSSVVYACRRAGEIAEHLMKDAGIPERNRELYADLSTSPPTPRCGAVVDSSFLGNSFAFNHIAETVEWDPTTRKSGRRYSDFWVDDPKGNQRSVFFGNYAESGSGSRLGKRSVTVGGMMTGEGGLMLGDGQLKGSVEIHTPTIVGESLGLGPRDGMQLTMRFKWPGLEGMDNAFAGCWVDQRHHLGSDGRPDLSKPMDLKRHNRFQCRLKGASKYTIFDWDLGHDGVH
jgi:hypothetical protein